MSQANNIRIGITQGDINGIGPEVILKAIAPAGILELFTPVLFANETVIRETAGRLGLEDFHYNVIESMEDIEDGVVNLMPVGSPDIKTTPGTPSPEGGRAAVEALEMAVKSIADGAFDLLVTAPIDKNTAQSENFHFPGHTEYLEDKFGVGGGKAMMIMTAEDMRVALVTTHLPLKDIGRHITKDVVAEAIRSFNRTLRMDFGHERPKIAVLSLNPHCGDGGLLGHEEERQIIPAIEECRKEGIMAFGPISADGLFGSGGYKKFDGVLAMYHDQGLAPFKAIAGTAGVNFTAGLDIVRTSPDHGTAYDLAGKGVADEQSMRQAIYTAIDIARRRDSYLEASENPLEIREHTAKEKNRKAEHSAQRKENAEELSKE